MSLEEQLMREYWVGDLRRVEMLLDRGADIHVMEDEPFDQLHHLVT